MNSQNLAGVLGTSFVAASQLQGDISITLPDFGPCYEPPHFVPAQDDPPASSTHEPPSKPSEYRSYREAQMSTQSRVRAAIASMLIASTADAQTWNSDFGLVELSGGAARATNLDSRSGCFNWTCALEYCWEDSLRLGSQTNWEGELLSPEIVGSIVNDFNGPDSQNGQPCYPGIAGSKVHSAHGPAGHTILAECESWPCGGSCQIKHPADPNLPLSGGASAIAASADLEFHIAAPMTLRVQLDGSKTIYHVDPCGLRPGCSWMTASTTPVSLELRSLDDPNFRISLHTQPVMSPPAPPYRGISREPHRLDPGTYRVRMHAWGIASDYDYSFPGKDDSSGWTSAWFSGQFKLQPAESLCEEDLDANGAVDTADLSLLLLDWGTCPSCQADLDWNLRVDGSDLSLLLMSWGTCSDGD